VSEFELACYHHALVVAGILLASGWLSVSFLPPGRARTVVEWLSAMALYVAISVIMLRLFRRFWIEDDDALMGLFGFLCLLFGSGLLLSAVQCFRALVGSDPGSGDGVTH
jgi:hypothetical protein